MKINWSRNFFKLFLKEYIGNGNLIDIDSDVLKKKRLIKIRLRLNLNLESV